MGNLAIAVLQLEATSAATRRRYMDYGLKQIPIASKSEPDGQARLTPHIAPYSETPDFIRSDPGPLPLLDCRIDRRRGSRCRRPQFNP